MERLSVDEIIAEEVFHAVSEDYSFTQNIKSISKINNTFQGNGYFLKFITKNF